MHIVFSRNLSVKRLSRLLSRLLLHLEPPVVGALQELELLDISAENDKKCELARKIIVTALNIHNEYASVSHTFTGIEGLFGSE